LLGALRLAERDAALGRLDDDRLENIHKTVSEIIEDLAAHEFATSKASSDAKSGKGKVGNVNARTFGSSVFCLPGLGRLDDCAALVVADTLKRQGVGARTMGVTAAIEADNAEILCVCFLEDVTEARTDFTRRKLSRLAPAAKVVVCLLGQMPVRSDTNEPSDTDAAPRSLQGVLAAIEKSAASRNRREQLAMPESSDAELQSAGVSDHATDR
jgi:hypothetical protein